MRVVTLKDPTNKTNKKTRINIRKHRPIHAVKLIDD